MTIQLEPAGATAGVISAFVMRTFGLEVEVLLCAAVGSFIGVMMREAVPHFDNKADALWHFFKIVGVVMVGTVLMAWLIPIALTKWPNMIQTSVAGLGSFILVCFYTQLYDLGKFIFVDLARQVFTDIGKRVVDLIPTKKGD